MTNDILLISFSIYFVFLSETYALTHIVNTDHGKVQGQSKTTLLKNVKYYSFTGIPYAAPPIGHLRFRPPQPLESWEGVKSATKEKPPCMQYNNDIKKGQPLGIYGNEDCLFLDVFTSVDNNQTKNPIIVFLHNSNFRNSYNKTRDYAPDFFIEENVTVVTIAHRLSIFGFLSLEDDELTGNSGLRDVVTGLQWIQANIANFGGDPNKVTLMGSQGGAALVDLLLHTNSKDLFHAAILQGGTSYKSMYLQKNAKARALKLAELLDINTQTILQQLKDIPAQDILKKEWIAVTEDYFKEEQKSILPFGPIVEKNSNGLLTDYPEQKSKKINIPLMIGFNSHEGLETSLQYLIEPRYLSFVEQDFPFMMPRRLQFRFDPLKKEFYEAINEIKKFYFKAGKVDIRKPYEFVAYISDVTVNYAVDYAVQRYSTSGDLFYYYFDYLGDLNENRMNILKLSTVNRHELRAAAGDELCYLFLCPDLIKKYKKLNYTSSEDIIFQRYMVRMWTNFAKYGTPTPDNDSVLSGLKWVPYVLSRKNYLHIGKKIDMKQNLLNERFKFWDEFIEKWEQHAINGIVTDKGNLTIKEEL